MLDEIKNKYNQLSDGVIHSINYTVSNLGAKAGSIRNVILDIQTFNYENEGPERIKLAFLDVVEFKFVESKKTCNTVVFELYMSEIDDLLIFDFNPILIHGYEILERNPASNFYICCKEIKFELTDLPVL